MVVHTSPRKSCMLLLIGVWLWQLRCMIRQKKNAWCLLDSLSVLSDNKQETWCVRAKQNSSDLRFWKPVRLWGSQPFFFLFSYQIRCTASNFIMLLMYNPVVSLRFIHLCSSVHRSYRSNREILLVCSKAYWVSVGTSEISPEPPKARNQEYFAKSLLGGKIVDLWSVHS